jgi:hypothetical protein
MRVCKIRGIRERGKNSFSLEINQNNIDREKLQLKALHSLSTRANGKNI